MGGKRTFWLIAIFVLFLGVKNTFGESLYPEARISAKILLSSQENLFPIRMSLTIFPEMAIMQGHIALEADSLADLLCLVAAFADCDNKNFNHCSVKKSDDDAASYKIFFNWHIAIENMPVFASIGDCFEKVIIKTLSELEEILGGKISEKSDIKFSNFPPPEDSQIQPIMPEIPWLEKAPEKVWAQR